MEEWTDEMKSNLLLPYEDCICNDESYTLNETCVICNNVKSSLLTESQRVSECPIHKKIRICGEYEYVCESCKELGWYSTAGYGGKTKHINSITNEVRNI